MSVQVIEKQVLSSNKQNMLHGKVYLPEGEPRGLFHVVHGMTEHIGRYDGFMREMAEYGYVVFGYDHLGHGYTAKDAGELGFIAHKDGWRLLVDDVFVFGSAVKAEYGIDLPYILMGHSMGSFIVRLAAAKYDMQDKLIVMGTGGPNPASAMGLLAIKVTKLLKGERHISPGIENLAFGKYNERFGNDDMHNWLTKIPEVRLKYKQDPFCTFHFTTSALGDLVKLNRESTSRAWAAAMNKQKPVLFVSGGDDPVGDYGAGVRASCDMLRREGVPAEIKIYENCRHEILNDTCREEVIADIRNFFNE